MLLLLPLICSAYPVRPSDVFVPGAPVGYDSRLRTKPTVAKLTSITTQMQQPFNLQNSMSAAYPSSGKYTSSVLEAVPEDITSNAPVASSSNPFGSAFQSLDSPQKSVFILEPPNSKASMSQAIKGMFPQ